MIEYLVEKGGKGKTLFQPALQVASKGNPLTSLLTGTVMEKGYVRSQALRALVSEYIEKKTQKWEAMGEMGGKRKRWGRSRRRGNEEGETAYTDVKTIFL